MIHKYVCACTYKYTHTNTHSRLRKHLKKLHINWREAEINWLKNKENQKKWKVRFGELITQLMKMIR